jgi:uncharacterized membrane protein
MTMTAPLGLGHRLAPPRFIAFLALSLAGFGVAFLSMGWARAAMIGFDVGAAVFLLSCIPLLGRAPDAMRDSAERNDANRVTLLAITGMVCSVILVAIAEELSARQSASAVTIALIIGTLLLAWLFSNMIYALHYAHLFYTRGERGKDSGGIDFPGDEEPDYWDFIYFAFTLGMTFQTSDVEITGRPIRRIVILHCFAAFVFNIGVLAFTINVLGG